MKTDLPFDKVVRRGVLLCAAGAAGIAALAWLSWAFDHWRLITLSADYIPMAPCTALLLLLMAAATLLRLRRPDTVAQTSSLLYRGFPTRGAPYPPQPSADWKSAIQQVGNLRYDRRVRWPARAATDAFAFAAVVVTALLSLSVLMPDRFGLAGWVEGWLAPTTATVGSVPVGRMSPLTAWAFLLTAAALLLQLSPFDHGRLGPRFSAGLALGVVLIGLVVVLGYALGAPLLYGRQTIPMAVLTGVAFALLGLALLLASGAAQWGLDLLTAGSSPEPAPAPAGDAPKPTVPVFLIVLFVCLMAAIGASGFFYLKRQMADSRRTAQEALAAIADLKAGQIVEWRKENLAHARSILESRALADHFQELLANPTNAAAKDSVMNSMTAWQKHLRYARVRLWDQNQRVRFAVPASADRAAPADAAFVAQTLRTNQVLLPDLHLDPPAPERECLDLFVPLLPTRGASAGAETPLGVLQLEINPADFLFPLIQSWPTPSATAETLLLRRDGNEVLYLNNLRHRTNTALRLRLPLTRTDVPAVRAALGEVGLRTGVDYRSVPVLAALRAIPDSPWFMVAKVDQAEIYAPPRRQALVAGFIVGVLLLATLLGAALLWRQRNLGLLRHALAQEQQRQALTERLANISKQANDIILLADTDWRILEANDRALETYGYTLAELQRLTMRDLRPPDRRAEFDRQLSGLDVRSGAVYETVHQRKDRTTLPVENSVRRIELAGVPYHQCILRDITERKRAEEALRQSEERFRSLVDTMSEGLGVQDANARITFMNRRGYEMLGYELDELLGQPVGLLFDAENQLILRDQMARRRAGERQSYEIAWRRKDGGTLHTIIAPSPRFDEHGNLIESVAVFTDITARKLAEQALAKAAAEWQTTFDAVTDTVWLLDKDQRIVRCNKATAAQFHRDEAQVLGCRCWEIVHGAAEPIQDCPIRRMQTSLRRETMELQVGPHWFEIAVDPVLDTAGQLVGAVHIIRDTTDRKQAEQELRALFMRQEAILTAIPDIIAEVDTNKVYTWMNQAGLEFFGDDALGKEAAFYFVGEQDTYGAVQPLFHGDPNVIYVESWQRRRDGEKRLLAWWCRVLKDANGNVTGALSSARDITDRKQAEAETRRLLDETKRARADLLSILEDQRETEAALRESEERLRLPLQAANQGLYDLNVQTGDAKVSPEYATMLGYDPVTFQETNARWIERLHPDDRERVAGIYRAYIRGELSLYQVEFRQRTADGQWKWILSLGKVVEHDSRGQPLRMLGTHTDITARKQAEDAVRQRGEDLANLLEVSKTLAVTLAFEPVLQAATDGATKLLGLESAAIYLLEGEWLHLWATTPPLDPKLPEPFRRARLVDHPHIREAMSTGRPVLLPDSATAELTSAERIIIEARGLHTLLYLPLKAGEQVVGTLIVGAIGAPRLISDAQIDLSRTLANLAALAVTNARLYEAGQRHVADLEREVAARKQAEEALRKSEERYRRLHETMTDPFVLVDMAGHILECNWTYREMLGYTEAELRQLTYHDITPQQWHAFEARIVQEQILSQGFSGVYEKEYRRKDGTVFPVELRVSLVRDDAGQPAAMSAIVRDITERKRAEAALRLSGEQLRALTQRLQTAREEEARHIARELHDELGQMLTGLKMDLRWVERRLEEGEAGPRANALLEKVVATSELVDATIKTVQRISSELRPSMLDKLGLVMALRYEARQFQQRTGIACLLRVPEPEPQLVPDAATVCFRICQEALTNITRHAAASNVEIEFHAEEAEGQGGQGAQGRRGGVWVLEVRDNGKGIASDKLADPNSLGLLALLLECVPRPSTCHARQFFVRCWR
jgi:PAS domain S-box-containing protein